MNCPKCNVTNSENAKFCKACGFDCKAALVAKPSSSTSAVRCLKCGTENAAAAKFCKGCGSAIASAIDSSAPSAAPAPPPVAISSPVLVPLVPQPALTQTPAPLLAAKQSAAPTPVLEAVLPPTPTLPPAPSPQTAPPPTPAGTSPQQAGVACFKCASLNSATAKFCKSCGVASPSSKGVVLESVPGPGPTLPVKKPLLLWACVAAAALVLLGGGGYWMFAGSSKAPVAEPTGQPTLPTQAVPPESPAVAAPAPAAIDAPPVSATTDAAAPSAASASSAVTPKTADTKPELPEVAPAPAPAMPAELAPAPTAAPRAEVPLGPTAAEREVARKKQAERDAKARQLARDKAMLDKTNRTLDDLLRN